ncbi:2OG-Fe(II) oxygenase [Halobacteriovorax sp. GB3]|uniref:2OG-Fe(II) oxygenase n=1 Tax=Halobacteriovorax sp. GB3 TaxID=2719615 RepID=UPI0023611A0D|nr:2OG-Fe(II) oxygenase [Halobacteriovorax sp. GB3]MDD0852000.1 2OG-Fe(II) oxygenase [Halobacteriovorax sp. GB3]
MTHEIKCKELNESGILIKSFSFPDQIIDQVKDKNFNFLDQWMLEACKEGGLLFDELKQYANFNSIEHIIALRKAETDEEGIWHCDGSRNLAFTWSLNLNPELIEGGELFFRKKGSDQIMTIHPPEFATLVVFCTGMDGYEHRVGKVKRGERLTYAGWCSF